ncbi:MAG: potassium transporter Kup [Planctomycetota bacterium]
MLTALGIVYGDIGTSPLYAIRECLQPAHGVPVTEANVLGVLSLIFWSLLVVISTKYLLLVMRADNRGEGGILALMSLLHTGPLPRAWGPRAIVLMGLFGAALLYGDGTITPAISVLSAIEGLEVATPLFADYVIPITCAILVGLFAFQRRGTAGVGILFGPVTLVWFLVLAALGVSSIALAPRVLSALSPSHGVAFLLHNGWHGFLVVGAVFLVVTGGEALYADMGHFGRRPIRLAWFGLVLPALLLNYFGQGALLLRDPTKISNPFYLMAPSWGLYPLVALSTAATVIASQAVISGAFSLSRQAIQLGYLPRMEVEHTSADEIGQIYVPAINWALLAATLVLVIGFRRSTNLAAAYGVAVTTTMVITTCLIFLLARRQWGWSLPLAAGVFGAFLVVDLTFFAANIVKVPDGGWFPLAVGAGVYLLFATWKRGRELLGERLAERSVPLTDVLAQLESSPPVRLPGRVAAFMTSSSQAAPPVLIHHLRHNGVLQERVLLLTVVTREVPYVANPERVQLEELGQGFVRVVAHFGFMETPTVARILRQCRARGLSVRKRDITFYLGRETLLATKRPGMAIWRERLFAFMSRNAQRATYYFRIPPEQVFEIGVQVEL